MVGGTEAKVNLTIPAWLRAMPIALAWPRRNSDLRKVISAPHCPSRNLPEYTPQLRNEDFQNWELVVSARSSALSICDDGNGHRLYAKEIESTDFPAPGVWFYFCNDTLMLPSEY